jgi:hypothetical protein
LGNLFRPRSIACPLQKKTRANASAWGFSGFFHKMAGLPASAGHLHAGLLYNSLLGNGDEITSSTIDLQINNCDLCG